MGGDAEMKETTHYALGPWTLLQAYNGGALALDLEGKDRIYRRRWACKGMVSGVRSSENIRGSVRGTCQSSPVGIGGGLVLEEAAISMSIDDVNFPYR